MRVVLQRPELTEQGQDLVLTLERELDILAIGDLHDLVRALGLGLALEDHLPGTLLERRLLLGEGAREIVALVPAAIGLAVRGDGADRGSERKDQHEGGEKHHQSLDSQRMFSMCGGWRRRTLTVRGQRTAVASAAVLQNSGRTSTWRWAGTWARVARCRVK